MRSMKKTLRIWIQNN